MKSPYPLYKSSPGISDPSSDPNQLDIFLNKPFWIWDHKEHDIKFKETDGKCCHVDILGRPQKDGKDYPIFDFQKAIFDALENNDSIWILKARGIGLSSFMIYYLTWKILSSSELDNESIFIISGTREEHANYLKERTAKLFERNFPSINLYTKYTEMILKNTWIKVFPSTVNSIKDVRGYFSCKAIWVDESDYVPENVIDELIAAITPYQTKSNAKIVLSSTPNKPNSIMQRIELDPNSKYFKLRLPYQLGVDKIYNAKEIELKKNGVEWKREMELQYFGKVGNVFTSPQLDRCMQLGQEYSTDKIPVSLYTLKCVGLDPAFSTSSFGLVTLEHIKTDSKDILRVIQCELIDKADPNQMVQKCWDIWQRNNWMNTFFFIDPSNRAMVNLLKIKWQESLSWESKSTFGHNIRIRPISFTNENKRDMLSNLHAVVTKEYLAIDPKYDKLLTSLRTCYAEELNLKKEVVTYNDLLDSIMLALKGYDIK